MAMTVPPPAPSDDGGTSAVLLVSDTLAPGLQLDGRYTLRRPLGTGGMATVWEATNEAGQRVAIKILTAGLHDGPEPIARFFLEARAANAIAHPGIVRVLDSGQTPWGAPFLVMEALQGLSLAQLLERHGRFTPAQAASVLVPVLDAVAAAHGAGVIHRDLKPGNVFLTLTPTPAVKLLDFGISKLASADARLTQTGMVFGTPAYMPPEQLRDAKSATPASDLYAVGAMAFELLTGAPPFVADNALALSARVLSEATPSLHTLRPDVPLGWAQLVDAALAKDPSQRPASALRFKQQLEALARPDPAWLFTRVKELADLAPAPVKAPPRAARAAGPGLSLAVLVDRLARTGQSVPVPVLVRLAYDVLLDPATPPTLGPAQVSIARDGHVHAEPGAPLKSARGNKLVSYVAPEAWDGAPSAASLQFSLAAVLVQALSGAPPFEAEDVAALRARLVSGAPVPLPEGTPAPLAAVLTRMLSVDPRHRYADLGACAAALAAPFRATPLFSRATDELAALVRSAQLTPVMKPPTSEPPPASKLNTLQVLAVVVVLLGLSVGWAWWKYQRATAEGLEPVLALTPVVEPTVVEAPPELVEDAPPPGPKPSSDYAVTSEPPGAALWVDGQFRGNTPGTLTLPQDGKHALRLELPAHKAIELELKADGEKHPLFLPLTTTSRALGHVRFDVSDDTRVWLDDALVAEGRLELPVEANVPHHFQLERGGVRSAAQPLQVGVGEVKTLRPR